MLHKPTLTELRSGYEAAEAHFKGTIARLFPGADEWHWYRAVSHIHGDDCRRNDDTSRDRDMNASVEIHAAHQAYIVALHAFYRLRDGEHGVLGGRAKR